MIGVIVVGEDLGNMEEALAARLPPRTRDKLASLLDEAAERVAAAN